jgi:ABC-type sulfate/molybdate transport systems ATPase subunit
VLELSIAKRLREFRLQVAFDAADELVVLFGPSGAGKTVTLRSIVGILRPDAGYIRVDGAPLFDAAHGVDLPMQRRRVGYVPQNYGLFPHLSVAENVAYGLGSLPAAARRARVGEMLQRLELSGFERRRPHELSGGQQQRVALARALVTQPRILLLDEPFAALDSALRLRLRRDVQRIHRQFPLTTLFISHDLGEAYALAEKIVVVDRGAVLQVGSREDVFQRPASARVARLTGAVNVFPAALAPATPTEIAAARLTESGVVRPTSAANPSSSDFWLPVRPVGAPPLVAVVAPPLRLLARPPTVPLPRHVDVCIRPEAIAVLPASAAPGPNRLPARIVDEMATAAFVTLFCEPAAVSSGSPLPTLEVLVPVQTYEALRLRDIRACTLLIPPERITLLPRADA